MTRLLVVEIHAVGIIPAGIPAPGHPITSRSFARVPGNDVLC
jgi:hypothetical protein